MYLEIQKMIKSKKTEIFVPGRLCLFGEHSDWAGSNKVINSKIVPGCAIVTGIQQGIYAEVEENDSFLYTSDLQGDLNNRYECQMNPQMLKAEAEKGGFYSYIAGVASCISENYPVLGIHIHVKKMDLPMKKGLSSSAAICVLVAKAFNDIYGLNLNTMEIMKIAFLGEQRTPSRCGRLDQACAFGTNPVEMIFDGNEIKVNRLSVGKPLYYVFADLMAGKDTVKILADLNSAYPFYRNEKEKRLHQALGQDNQRITKQAVQLISEGNAEKLGKLMTEAQELFDENVKPMCEDQLTAPVLHRTLNDSIVKGLTYGGKGVGSQGDGTVQFLAKNEVCQLQLKEYLQNKCGMPSYCLTLRAHKEIRKAIIPIAGFGTRLYPETRFVKKELCPVVDKDGLLKPILLILIEELIQAGIEKICLVISPDEKSLYENLFFKPISIEHYRKLTPAMREYEDNLMHLKDRLEFVYQNEPGGFGHAVFQAAEFAGDDPVLLLLGDTIYESFDSRSCIRQLIDAYELYGEPIVGIQKIPLEAVENYGIFSGTWEDEQESIMKCTMIVEKPNVAYARDYLGVRTDRTQITCFGAFGSYVLTRDVFEILQSITENQRGEKTEIGLTEALDLLCKKSTVYGFLIDGKSYDLGNPEAYRRAVSYFGLTEK